ncbi:trypsin-like serine peptidase [Streptomyces sp. LZ34]
MVTAAILALAGAGPAAAESGSAVRDGAQTTASPTPRLADGRLIDSPTAAKTLADYWTPERMKKAIPLDRAIKAKADTAGVAKPTGEPGTTMPARGPAGTVSPLITESAAVGKVFFTDPSDGLDYACSASALNSASKQMLLTAGHCVHEGSGGTWMTNWTYAPRYRSGVSPFGSFAAKQFRTFDAWINSSDLGRDVAMVTTWPLDGNKVVDVTGGHGLAWNFSSTVPVTVFGYPGNVDDGEIQQWCAGTTRLFNALDGRIEIGCNFGPGASGGPWLWSFDDTTGLGFADGVTSTITSNGFNQSPYFDDAVKTMYDLQGIVT